MEQLELDLDDRHQYIESFMTQRPLYGDAEWCVFSQCGQFYLGVRVHGPVETDYEYCLKVSYEEAEWLVSREERPRVWEFCDCVRKWVG